MDNKILNVLNAIDEVQFALSRLKYAITNLEGKTSIGTLGVTPRKSKDFKEQFLAILQQNKFNKSKVARVYGVQRRTIYRWMEQYGID